MAFVCNTLGRLFNVLEGRMRDRSCLMPILGVIYIRHTVGGTVGKLLAGEVEPS